MTEQNIKQIQGCREKKKTLSYALLFGSLSVKTSQEALPGAPVPRASLQEKEFGGGHPLMTYPVDLSTKYVISITLYKKQF